MGNPIWKNYMASLLEYLEQNRPAKEFRPVLQYIPDGDCLIFYFKPDAAYAERVDELLTVYRSEETEELTGCEIKGVQCILKRLEKFGVRIMEKSVDLRILFAGYSLSVTEPKRGPLEELRQAAENADARVDTEELVLA
jgi:hypothetical protein